MIRELCANLCVNNLYSGSKVTGGEFPAASSDRRIKNLHTAKCTPDMVLLYIGFNDFGNGVQITRRGIKSCMGEDLSVFYDAYKHMICSIKKQYPKTTIVCGTLMRTSIREEAEWRFPEMFGGRRLEDYNEAVRKICKKQECHLADFSAMNMRYETLDGSHPTVDGHRTLADAWKKCLMEL